MTHVKKLRLYPILRWVSSNLSPNLHRLQKTPISGINFPCSCSYNDVNYYNLKYFSTMAIKVDEDEDVDVDVEKSSISSNGETLHRITPHIRKEAQGALLDYLYSTRNLPFIDAEYLSKNSPQYLKKLLKIVNLEPDVRRSMTRFLRYYPVNEFELFFESIGLDPCEFVPRLPRDLMYLSDEDGLLDNYRVLCEYGIARSSLGKIYRMSREVFQYGNGVLESKLRNFEDMGLSKPVIAKAVSFNPYLLIDDADYEFCKAVSKLQCLGCEYDWIEEHLSENASYNWRQITELLVMLNEMGFTNADLRKLLRQHPELLFDSSGRSTYSLIGLLIKFGSTKNGICSMFLHFPKVRVQKFVWNLRRALNFFSQIQMDGMYIGRISRAHYMMLGTSSLKKPNSILASLRIGRTQLCEHIVANPLELKKWVLRAKVERLPDIRDTSSCNGKIKFLSSIGFAENSKEMEKAIKLFRGKGDELHERFDCLVKAGLSEEDVVVMIKAAPQILNQSKEVLETKVNNLVNNLGYPVLSLKTFPGYLNYTEERVKLRFSMYKWLVNQSVVRSTLSLRTIIGCTEPYFLRKYVNKHPEGLEMWQEFHKKFSV